MVKRAIRVDCVSKSFGLLRIVTGSKEEVGHEIWTPTFEAYS